MGHYGIKLSKAGFDVKTADLKDQILNSTANSLKIWMTGTANISVSAYTGFAGTGEGFVDINHNLGYRPFFLTFFKLRHASKFWLQDSLDDSVLFNNYIEGRTYADATKIRMAVNVNGNNLAAFTAVGRYIIFIDKGMT